MLIISFAHGSGLQGTPSWVGLDEPNGGERKTKYTVYVSLDGGLIPQEGLDNFRMVAFYRFYQASFLGRQNL